jgi:hypothetical protein
MKSTLACALALFALLNARAASAATYYIAPNGNDGAAGTSEAAALKTFAKAFSKVKAGDELVLLDGDYSLTAGTGYISYQGANSAQIPSGLSVSQPTVVRAKNPGRVKVHGYLFVGRSFRKDSYIRIEGITFEGGGQLYNTSYVTVKNSGFHSTSRGGGWVFAIGTNDHTNGNSHNLIEDVWIWGQERIIAINYRADRNVWRRVLLRGDGCNSSACTGSGNPNVGITVYDSTNTSLQNVLVVDRVLNGGSEYADFAIAQHTPGTPYGNNEWLGTLSLKSPDAGYYFEPDATTMNPAQRLVNCVAWDTEGTGINLARKGQNDLRNCTVRVAGGGSDGIRIAPELAGTGGTLRNVIVIGNGRFGVNSAHSSSFVDVYGNWDSKYNQAGCTSGCRTTNPLADGNPPSLRYIARVEEGSALSGTGSGGDYGANIVYRYGSDGLRYDDPGFNQLTQAPLWPWPNEQRLKKEMCTDTGVTRGFCGAASLTDYIWTQLGNPNPYGSGGTTVPNPPGPPQNVRIIR